MTLKVNLSNQESGQESGNSDSPINTGDQWEKVSEQDMTSTFELQALMDEKHVDETGHVLDNLSDSNSLPKFQDAMCALPC